MMEDVGTKWGNDEEQNEGVVGFSVKEEGKTKL